MKIKEERKLKKMPRPKLDKHKAKIYLTINEDILNKARESINNISAFVETCLIKHIYSQQKKNKNSTPKSSSEQVINNDLSEEELQKIIDSIEI